VDELERSIDARLDFKIADPGVDGAGRQGGKATNKIDLGGDRLTRRGNNSSLEDDRWQLAFGRGDRLLRTCGAA